MTAPQEFGPIEPAEVWANFLPLTRIARPSKQEHAVMEHLKAWADELGYPRFDDAVGNICIRVPASPGCEAAPVVILQNHVDIVAVTRDGADDADASAGHIPIERGDFDGDGVFTESRDGGWLYAPKTTMGADNGVGCAMAMAIAMSTDLQRPPLELLFTVDEEEGMSGAMNLDAASLKITGKFLINIDTEDDDELTIGSAGGRDIQIRYTAERVSQRNKVSLTIEARGLVGGHSGVEIAAGRANAIRMVARCLAGIAAKVPVCLCKIVGGSRRNAIPQTCRATFLIDGGDLELATSRFESLKSALTTQFEGVEPAISLTLVHHDEVEKSDSFSLTASSQIIDLLVGLPHGVLGMTAEIPDLVETSCNLALVDTKLNVVDVVISCRSATDGGLDDVTATLASLARLSNAELEVGHSYPGWKPDLRSELLEVAREAYERLFAESPKVKAIHAGLECGVLAKRIAGVDCISIGPNIRGNHAPGERVEIASVGKTHAFVTEVLSALTQASRTEN